MGSVWEISAQQQAHQRDYRVGVDAVLAKKRPDYQGPVALEYSESRVLRASRRRETRAASRAASKAAVQRAAPLEGGPAEEVKANRVAAPSSVSKTSLCSPRHPQHVTRMSHSIDVEACRVGVGATHSSLSTLWESCMRAVSQLCNAAFCILMHYYVLR